jgi:hypothetical protein
LIIVALHIGVAQRMIYGGEQSLSAEGFREETANVFACSPVLIADLVAACQEKYRHFRSRSLDHIKQLKAVHSRHAYIGDEAIDAEQVGFKQRRARRKREHSIASRLEQILQ